MPFARKPTDEIANGSIDQRIRRAATKLGLRATRSRWQAGTSANEGGWQITNGRGTIMAGSRFNLSDAEALAWLGER